MSTMFCINSTAGPVYVVFLQLYSLSFRNVQSVASCERTQCYNSIVAYIYRVNAAVDSTRGYSLTLALIQGAVTPIDTVISAATGVTMWSQGYGGF